MAVPLVPLKARRGKELMYLDDDRACVVSLIRREWRNEKQRRAPAE
jgi:hypothetical protein